MFEIRERKCLKNLRSFYAGRYQNFKIDPVKQ